MTDPHAATITEVDRMFREVVLCLGGIFAVRRCDDALIWQVTRSLESVYRRTRARLLERDGNGDTGLPSRRAEPHPAVEDLLARIGR